MINQILESVEVQIGKRTIKLKGDANTINAAADKLNETIEIISQNSNSIGGDTLLILAGLNLAENQIIEYNDNNQTVDRLNSELNQMTSYLNNLLAQA